MPFAQEGGGVAPFYHFDAGNGWRRDSRMGDLLLLEKAESLDIQHIDVGQYCFFDLDLPVGGADGTSLGAAEVAYGRFHLLWIGQFGIFSGILDVQLVYGCPGGSNDGRGLLLFFSGLS